MAEKIYETTDVSPERLDAVVAGYSIDDPTNIEKIKQDNGNWTVRATFETDETNS